MTLGGSTNNQNKQNFDPTAISRMKFVEDGDPEVAKLELGFKYWKDKLEVYTQIWNGSKYDELSRIYLSPLKAATLSVNIKNFLNSENRFTNPMSNGVQTGIGETRGLIYLCNAADSTEKTPKRVLVIASVNKNGEMESKNEFHFRVQQGLTFKGSDLNTFKNVDFPDLEVDVFTDILDSFVSACAGANAFYTMDMNRFNNTVINNKLNSIMDKLGIERKGNYSKTTPGSSYFDNNKSGGAGSSENTNRGRSSATTLEEMEEMLEE